MRILCLALLALLSLASTTAHADSLRSGFPICASEAMLDQMYSAIAAKDVDGMDYLFDHGCFMTKAGVNASILDRSNMGARAHVRIYTLHGAAEAWTSIAALRSYQSN
jgi:hypothetical protein